MARTPLILVPPSEGKAPGGDGPPWPTAEHRHPELDGARREVIAALAEAMTGPSTVLAKLLGVTERSVPAVAATNLEVDVAPTRPAIERYTGVLYDALAYAERPARIRRRLDAQIRIFSGLWGVLTPSDPIPDYKLRMGASLPGTGRLATWWRPRLTDVLAPEVAGRTVWDLLPNEHSAAWAPRTTSARQRIVVRFCDDKVVNGSRRLVTVSHWNKLLKGSLVPFLVEHQLTDPEGLAGFAHPEGYAYRPDLDEVTDDATIVTLVAPR